MALAALFAMTIASQASAAVSYVGRVASLTQSASSTTMTLTSSRQVAAGDAVLVAVLLSSTSITGAVNITDSAGNTYTVDRDLNDGASRDRVLVYSARNTASLPAGGTITITYPTAAQCYASADEFAGVVALDMGSSASAKSTTFNSGSTATTSQAGELLFGVVGNESGSAPTWAAGWTALPVLSIGTDRIGAAYQVSSATGQFAATGATSGTWMASITTYTGGPVQEAPPVARLSVSQLASPALTVKADGSASTDGDATPIGSYHFDFGDNSPIVDTTAPTATANHTYAASGTYTIKLTCSDTSNLNSSQVSQSISVTSAPPPVDNPPVARLTVSQLASPALTVTADGSTSTDTDATPITTYHFDFGDNSAVVNTTAPAATANHTYAAAGTYTVKLTCTDGANLNSSQVSKSITVTPPVTGGGSVAVFAGYYDTHHPHNFKPKPSIWRTSPNTVFVGAPDKSGGDDWDTSALRVDNLTTSTLSGVVVTCDIGTKHYALWGTRSIAPGQHLVLCQTAFDNFDGSDRNDAGCYSCNPNDCLTKVLKTVPVVHVTVNGVTTHYPDVTQQINTGGVDRAGCPYTGTRNDESEDWKQIAPGAPMMAASEAPGEEHGVQDDPPLEARQAMWLGDPYPNPSHGEVAVHFSLPETGPVKLEVFDVTGRQIRVALDQVLDAGEYEENAKLWGASPGVYFYRLTTRQGQQRRTFVLER